jgi:hypothetical protein
MLSFSKRSWKTINKALGRLSLFHYFRNYNKLQRELEFILKCRCLTIGEGVVLNNPDNHLQLHILNVQVLILMKLMIICMRNSKKKMNWCPLMKDLVFRRASASSFLIPDLKLFGILYRFSSYYIKLFYCHLSCHTHSTFRQYSFILTSFKTYTTFLTYCLTFQLEVMRKECLTCNART